MATTTFPTTLDASALASLSGSTETGAGTWNGKYRATPVGVGGSTNQLSFRGMIKVPIDFTTLTGAVQITAATLSMNYFNVSGYNQTYNTGTRTMNVHRALVAFTESPGTDVISGWASSSTQNWDTRVKTASTHYDSTIITSLALSGTVADKAVRTLDVLPYIQKIAPTSLLVGSTTGVAGAGLTDYGLMFKMATVSQTGQQGAAFYSQEGAASYTGVSAPTITLTYTTNTPPEKPVPTSPLNLVLQSGTGVTFTATMTDVDAGDSITKFDLEISKNSDWSSPFYSQQYSNVTTATIPMNNFDSNINYYWRVRSYDTKNVASAWSDLTTASFTAPTNIGGFPPPEGDPNFATTVTPARNKYRLEFYKMLTSLNGFDPKPVAVVFDAKKIGISQQVNDVGEFFFTLRSDHPQIDNIDPQNTFWRACRWDEDAGLFRVVGEGLVTNSVSYPSEVIFYGIDKLGMLGRTLVTSGDINGTYSHVGVTLANLHDSIMGRNIVPASITGIIFPATSGAITAIGASVTSGSITGISFPVSGTVRYTCTNTFAVGDVVSITGVTPTGHNLTNVTVTAATGAYFEVLSAVTVAWTSGGLATKGTRFTCTNTFLTGDTINVTGATPSYYNYFDAVVTSATSTYFDVAKNISGTWTSGGTAQRGKTGTVRFLTAANLLQLGGVVSITGINPTNYNLAYQTITARASTYFEISSSQTGAYVSGGTATPAKTVMDMGWGASPTNYFRDYSVTNSGNPTATAVKSIKATGQYAINALAGLADIIMAGTTNKIIIENPNIGLPAAKIDTMSVGLRYRHLTAVQVVKPTWWFQYGVNIKRFKIEDNLNMMATRASVINSKTDSGSVTLVATNGTTDPDLYAKYGLVDKVESIADERNDLDFAKQLQYNLHPDRLFTITTDTLPNSIFPLKGYSVGDDITVYIVDDQVSIKKDFTLVAQQWIGNSNGAEYLAFGFAQKLTQGFVKTAETSDATTNVPTNTNPSSTSSATMQSGNYTNYSWLKATNK